MKWKYDQGNRLAEETARRFRQKLGDELYSYLEEPMAKRLKKKIYSMGMTGRLFAWRWCEQAGYRSVILVRWEDAYIIGG